MICVTLTKFESITRVKNTSYGYIINDGDGNKIACDSYDSRDEVLDEFNEVTFLDYMQQNHEEYYDAIMDEGQYMFNYEIYNVDDNLYDIHDEDDEELDSVMVSNPREARAFENIIENAADDLI